MEDAFVYPINYDTGFNESLVSVFTLLPILIQVLAGHTTSSPLNQIVIQW